jgi:copper homeostasis protein
MGFDRLLTSGLKQRAIDGLKLIESMHQEFGNKIEIMAGSGVNPDNAAQLAGTGISNLHFTARKKSDEDLIPGMGVQMVTDESKILTISNLFR